MATPDIQNLFERFLQIYGGQSGSTAPTRSEPRYQSSQPAYSVPADAYGGEDGYAPTGGVLRGWTSSSPAAPWWAGALTGPGGMPAGLSGPRLGGRFGGLPFPPVPVGRGDVVEIPNPHLERYIPQSTRDIWNAAGLLPWILRDKLVGDERSNGAAEGQNGALLSKHSPEPPDNRPGNQRPSIVGPVILEKAKRRDDFLDGEPQVSEQPDPNHRELTTVGPGSQEAGSASDPYEPSLIGWRKRRKKTIRRVSPSGGSSRRTNSSVGVGNNGTGGKGPASNGGDDDDYCVSRRWEELDECNKRWRDGEYAHPDHYGGCKKRAEARWDLCNRNGGTPPPWEPKKWSMDPDEEVFINIGR